MTKSGTRVRLLVIVASALTLVGAAFALWQFLLWQEKVASEAAAQDELKQLGALVVMDVQRTHVASVNLTPVAAIDDGQRFNRACELLDDLPWLQALDVSRTEFSDEQANHLRNLHRLKSLTAVNTPLTDSGLKHVATLKELEALNLSGTQITSAGLTSLKSLDELKVVDISRTKVTGSLRPLTELPSLEWLVIRNLALNGEAVASLSECPSLRTLSIEGTTVSPASIRVLKAKRPALRVEGVATPSAHEAPPADAEENAISAS